MTRATFTNTTGFRVRWGTSAMEQETKWIDGKGEVTSYGWVEVRGQGDGTGYDTEKEAREAWDASGHGFPWGHGKCQVTIERVTFKAAEKS